jgi:hypothetical protein
MIIKNENSSHFFSTVEKFILNIPKIPTQKLCASFNHVFSKKKKKIKNISSEESLKNILTISICSVRAKIKSSIKFLRITTWYVVSKNKFAGNKFGCSTLIFSLFEWKIKKKIGEIHWIMCVHVMWNVYLQNKIQYQKKKKCVKLLNNIYLQSFVLI